MISPSLRDCSQHFRYVLRSKRTLFLVGLLLALAANLSAQTWNLTWSDEFNGAANSPINPSNWQYDTGILNVNNEVEYYCQPGSNTAPCNSSQPNANIDGQGHLVIQAIQVSSSVAPYSGSWTSARLNTGNNLQSFQFGRLESSMALPVGAGLWPAFWALGANISSVGWPMSGEMDFMENVPASSGLGPTVVKSTLHGGNSGSSCYCGGNGLGQNYNIPSTDPNGPDVTTFHTYGAIWSPNMVQFYVDDPTNVFFVRTASDVPSGFTWDFNHPFFLLLNLAVGGTGSWPGPPNDTPPNATPNPALMVVDYVRAYTASPVTAPTMSASSITLTAGQTGTSTVSLNSAIGAGRVYLSCATNAPKATCSIASSDALNQYTVDFSTVASATANVSVTTTANTAAAAVPIGRWGMLSGALLSCVGLLPWNRSRRYFPALAVIALLAILAFLPACTSGSPKGSGGGGGGSNGTPPGNYTVTVNGYTVSNGGGTPDSTVNIALAVN